MLAEMQDTVRIEPHRFSQDMEQELSDELNKKFANKVSHEQLAMAVVQVISIPPLHAPYDGTCR